MPPAALPHQLAVHARGGPCVGRERELERLLACWQRVSEGTVVAIVRGEAGIGKSRLAAELASEVHRRGGVVTIGLCSAEPQRAYEPITMAIDASESQRGEQLDPPSRRNGEVMLQHSGATSTVEVTGMDLVAAEHHRSVTQASLHDALLRMAMIRPTLVVIEDLHWASTGTRDVLARVARFADATPMMLLLTTRDDALSEVGPVLARLERLPSVEVVSLAGLDVASAALLVAAGDDRIDVAEAVRTTGGNPLYLRELTRGGPSGRSLQELAAERFGRLPPSDLEVLDAAALVGERVDATFLAEVLEREAVGVVRVLQRAEQAGLIVDAGEPGAFAFRHDVFRSARASSLAVSHRMQVHAAIAEALRREASMSGTSNRSHCTRASPGRASTRWRRLSCRGAPAMPRHAQRITVRQQRTTDVLSRRWSEPRTSTMSSAAQWRSASAKR